MIFKRASEPTDIIWENRSFTATDYFFRRALAYIIIVILLVCSFVVIFKVARASAMISAQFPIKDCGAIKSTYGEQF